MRIVFIGSEVPNTEHSTVTYSAFLFIKALKNAGHDVLVVVLQPQYNYFDIATRQRWMRECVEAGIQVEWVSFESSRKVSRFPGIPLIEKIRRLIWPQIADYFPHIKLVGKIASHLTLVQPDIIFLWSSYESVAATHGLQIAPRFAFMGDPVHLPELFRQYPPFVAKRLPISPSLLLTKLRAIQKSRLMIRLLSRCDAVTAGAAHHAEWFRRNGVPHCKYMPTIMAPDWGGLEWQNRRKQYPPNERFKIVLMGHVTGTATLSGLYLFANEILPVLEKALGDSFEIHVCGKGNLPADLITKLDRPSVRLRGFVDDIVLELLTCDVFLVPTPIKLGIRTRILYAWSVGCCAISHESNALGLAEMVHEENALLAPDGQALAQAIIRAYKDPDLRLRLRLGGRKTYETHFSPEVTSKKIIAEFERLASIWTLDKVHPWVLHS